MLLGKGSQKILFGGILVATLATGCSKSPYEYPAFSKKGYVNMVVEIPAGTSLKYEYNPKSEAFEVEISNGEERKINFLPYPGNYGFIPSTLLDSAKGGDGDPLDILLLSAALPQGIVLEVVPIAILKMTDRGERDDKIIAVPLRTDLRTIKCTTFSCLNQDYPDAVEIIRRWFTGYKGAGIIKTTGWMDEQAALEEIKKAQISNEQK